MTGPVHTPSLLTLPRGKANRVLHHHRTTWDMWGLDFDWDALETPLTAWQWPVATGLVYAGVCIVWKAAIDAKRGNAGRSVSAPLIDVGDLVPVQAVHNIVLSLGSAVMFIGLLVHMIDRSTGVLSQESGEGWFWVLCESESQRAKGGLWF